MSLSGLAAFSSGSRTPTATSKTRKRVKKSFANGDVYDGEWYNGVPDGTGTYRWADGSIYEGEWKRGNKHGIGRYEWASKAMYHGDWIEGCMQGIGTYKSPDGSTYTGSWSKDCKHGLGRKEYANGDIYDGLWKDGVSEGLGRYIWKDGNQYNGQWMAGCMEGKGTFVWACGERYDGEWKAGKEHGYGIFTSKEGGKYVGQWANGLRHGRGISYPPGTVQMEGGPATPRSKKKSSKEVGSDKGGTPRGIAVGSSALDTSAETSTSHGFETEGTYSGNESADERKTNASRGDGSSGGEDAGSTRNVPEFVSLRDYEDGKLVSDSKHHLEKLSSGRMSLRKKKGKGRVRVEQGEQIFKGHRSYDLMICLQTGLQHTITKHSREVKSKLTEDDFVAKNGVLFPRKGSTSTPPHTTGDFIWKDYSPAVFTKLREYWGLDAGATLRSICGGQGLREFGTPGKSSSVFYVSHDNRFIIKTMRKFEMKALLEMLPKYYQHCTSHESTLLTKFFGLHRVTPKGGRKVRFVVMGNLFNTSLRIHKRFDLKGSTLGREVGAKKKQSELTVYKDNDLDYTFKMESGWRDKLVYQVQKDCKFLEEANVMDYSLLLGVHFRDKAKEENGDANGLDKESVETCIDLSAIQDPILRDHLMVAHKSMAISTLASQNSDLSHRDGSDQLESLASSTRPRRTHTLRPVFGGPGGTDFLSHMFGKSKVELGVNMAATGIPRSQAGAASALSDTENDDVPNELKSGAKDVVLYMGIIDILQEYTITKQLENAYKTVRFNRESISSVDPTYYSQRFQAFFRSVFI